MGHHEGAKFSPEKAAKFQRHPTQAFSKGGEKRKTMEGKKKAFVFSFDSTTSFRARRQKAPVPERGIKSKLSPHKEQFTVKGDENSLLLYGKYRLLPNFRLKTWQKELDLPGHLSWRCLSSG